MGLTNTWESDTFLRSVCTSLVNAALEALSAIRAANRVVVSKFSPKRYSSFVKSESLNRHSCEERMKGDGTYSYDANQALISFSFVAKVIASERLFI